MVGVLGCEHVAGKAKEDFAGAVPPVLIAESTEYSDVFSRERINASRNVTVAELAIHHVGGWIQLPLLAVVHPHADSVRRNKSEYKDAVICLVVDRVRNAMGWGLGLDFRI